MTCSQYQQTPALGPIHSWALPNQFTKKAASKLVKGVTHLPGGGWYADQSTLAIRYMPIAMRMRRWRRGVCGGA